MQWTRVEQVVERVRAAMLAGHSTQVAVSLFPVPSYQSLVKLREHFDVEAPEDAQMRSKGYLIFGERQNQNTEQIEARKETDDESYL